MVCEEPPLVGGYKEELVELPGAILVLEEHDVGFFGCYGFIPGFDVSFQFFLLTLRKVVDRFTLCVNSG